MLRGEPVGQRLGDGGDVTRADVSSGAWMSMTHRRAS